MLGALGRHKPDNWDHLATKPLGAAMPGRPMPVAIGVNWYTSFDNPVQLHDGSWHLPNTTYQDLGTVRGGHCVCLAQMGGVKLLNDAWWRFYNQGQEGACEGFGHAKAQTLEKGVTFDPWFLYDEARRLEGTFPVGEGTTNRAVVRVLEADGAPEQRGPQVATRGAPDGPRARVAAMRWTISVEEVLAALGRPNAHAVPMSNSWGEDYPLVVWMPVPTLDRLLQEEGEADCVTDQ
jgi:hypothetical protein